ncbi:putative 3-hydroxyphenylpropionic transporter MhpT [Klebsiella pneumoniae subsp. rhinoscleromatis]|nr:putative 3-hydroxyphenylpropionic transporter MhpT [Klebsiella pneumoniae subsp. rhinoscleromatis]
MTKITTATPSRLVVTIGPCFMVALMEGLDLQAAGIAAVGMAQAFALDKMQMGWIFSAGILGLLPGTLVVYMLINWLPMLLVGQGFRASQAAGVMFSLQIGAACGTLLLGALMDKLTPLRMSLLIYSGILASLLALGSASSLTGMLLAGFVAGLFATGGQSVLYALAPLFYPAAIRATGVGHRRGGGASWGDERPAAGRQDAGPSAPAPSG